MKRLISVLIITGLLIGGVSVSYGGQPAAYKINAGDARWHTKLNAGLDALWGNVTDFATLINNWAIEDQIVTMIPVTCTYSDADTFTLPGNYTSRFAAGAVVHVHVAAGMVYGTVATSTYSAPDTTVNLANLTGNLTNPITRVYVVATRDGLWPRGPGYVVAKDYDADDGGERADLEAADSVAAGAGKQLVVSGTWVIDNDLTLSANLKILPDVDLQIATTKTLTINGTLEAGLYQIFSCTGTGKVVFGAGAVSEVFPQWWGFSIAASPANNTTYFNSMLLAFSTISPKVIVPPGTYSLDSTTINRAKLTIEGEGYRSVVFNYANSGSCLTFTALGINLKNIEIVASDASAVCVEIGPAAGRFVIDQCWFQGPATSNSSSCGIKFNQGASGSHNGTIRNTRLYRSYYGAYFASGTAKCNEILFDHCTIYGNGTDMVYGIYDDNETTGLKIINNDFENCNKTHLYSDGIGITVIGNRFEDTVVSSWQAYAVPPDTTTRNPMVFGSNSEKIYAVGNICFPTTAGCIFASNGSRYYFSDMQLGILSTSYDLIGNIVHKASSVGSIPIIVKALSGQTADLFESLLSDATKIWALSKAGVPYDKQVVATSSGGVLTCDCNTGRQFTFTMSESVTDIAFTNGIAGMEITLTIIYGGAYTLPAIANWTNGAAAQTYMALGAAPAAPATDNRHVLKFVYNGSRWVETSRNLSVRAAP